MKDLPCLHLLAFIVELIIDGLINFADIETIK